jgi:exodeoxyribonuclease VII large subunit
MNGNTQFSIFGEIDSQLDDSLTPDGRSRARALSISDLNEATKRLLDDCLPQVWVRGEVTNWRAAASGHRYFTLRDDRSQVRCVLFKGDAWKLPVDPEDGMEVLALGQPTLYPVSGRFQIIVRSLEGVGEGLWQIAFERLKKTLDVDGLLSPDRKRAIPTFPHLIGVLTSKKGAALRDVLTVIRRRSPWVDVVVQHCRVQGEGAALEIRDSLERLSSWGQCDAIILTRGGGSSEDLWCFNEEVAVRAVAACPIPVICAVGHETDLTLCELVADLRAPTPSVAAELAVPDVGELKRDLVQLSGGLVQGLRRCARRGRDRVRLVERRLPRPAVRGIENARARLQRLGGDLPRAVGGVLEASGGQVSVLAARLNALSPLQTLARGYAVPTGSAGQLLSGVEDFREEEAFQLRLRDGRIKARTEKVEPTS